MSQHYSIKKVEETDIPRIKYNFYNSQNDDKALNMIKSLEKILKHKKHNISKSNFDVCKVLKEQNAKDYANLLNVLKINDSHEEISKKYDSILGETLEICGKLASEDECDALKNKLL